MKYILSQIGDHGVNLGRGGSQLSHALSPLDLRLSSYLMAIHRFNYKDIKRNNMFNALPKSKYLPYIEVKREKK